MPKIIIEYNGNFEIRENVYENKIISMGKVLSDLGNSKSVDFILPSNPTVNIKILDSEGETEREINLASLMISDNKDREVLIKNIAVLLEKSL